MLLLTIVVFTRYSGYVLRSLLFNPLTFIPLFTLTEGRPPPTILGHYPFFLRDFRAIAGISYWSHLSISSLPAGGWVRWRNRMKNLIWSDISAFFAVDCHRVLNNLRVVIIIALSFTLLPASCFLLPASSVISWISIGTNTLADHGYLSIRWIDTRSTRFWLTLSGLVTEEQSQILASELS